FVSVGQDEAAATPLLQQQGEDDGFPGARGESDEHALLPLGMRREGCGNGFVLIRSWSKHHNPFHAVKHDGGGAWLLRGTGAAYAWAGSPSRSAISLSSDETYRFFRCFTFTIPLGMGPGGGIRGATARRSRLNPRS